MSEPEVERNVVPEPDDEEIDASPEPEPAARTDDFEIADQGTHFAVNLGHWARRERA